MILVILLNMLAKMLLPIINTKRTRNISIENMYNELCIPKQQIVGNKIINLIKTENANVPNGLLQNVILN